MREALGIFHMWAGAADANDFAHSVLQHLVDGLTKLVADFEKLYFEVKPVIEGNKYLVTTMLKNFQESYRFWQDVSEKVQASYNSQGVQSTAGKASGFAIKA